VNDGNTEQRKCHYCGESEHDVDLTEDDTWGTICTDCLEMMEE
jgi:hypothetical protein